MNCRVRPAEPVDLQEVQELYSMLFARMAELDPYACRAGQQAEEFLCGLIQEPDSELLLALQQEEVVGFAALKIMQTPPYACLQPHRYCYIFDLVVQKKRRGKGIGTLLLKEAERWARERGAEYMELGVLEANQGAQRLYARCGYLGAMRTLRKRIEL